MTDMETYLERIAQHHQNLLISNQRVFAQLRAELRRASFRQQDTTEKERFQSTTCMETINERSKEAEGESYSSYPQQDPDLELIFEHAPEKNSKPSCDPRSFNRKMRYSPGWTISTTKSNNPHVEKHAPLVGEFNHHHDELQE